MKKNTVPTIDDCLKALEFVDGDPKTLAEGGQFTVRHALEQPKIPIQFILRSLREKYPTAIFKFVLRTARKS